MASDQRTKLVEIDVELLDEADWNYKEPGSPEVMDKLVASIERDGSAGVLAVREKGEGRYEVTDGNHRLRAIKRLGWRKVRCENFGALSRADAILIARRRNYQWFEDDMVRLASLMQTDIFPTFSVEQLAAFMPDGASVLGGLATFGLDGTIPEPRQRKPEPSNEFIDWPVVIPREVVPVLNAATEIVRRTLKADGKDLHWNMGLRNGQVMELLCAELVARGEDEDATLQDQ